MGRDEVGLSGTSGMSWVVLDAQHRVIVITGGADGARAAAEWRDRGYRVEVLHGGAGVHAA